MRYRTILVHVDTGVASPERVQLAAALATRHDARLVGIGAGLQGPSIAINAGGAGVVSLALAQDDGWSIADELQAAQNQFESFGAGRGLRTEWRARVEFPSVALIEAATVADLLVVGSCHSPVVDTDYRTVNPGDVLMGAGRPVLVVPPGRRAIEPRRVVVAFKNTTEARRALVDSLPVLHTSRQVFLVNVRESRDDSAAVADAHTFLASHGVEARTETLSAGDQTVAGRLTNFVEERDADLIVAGAYGRSRFREWIFGGVTGELLANCPIACLLSH
jgi:nucleotide-binding universal stress UspA family protein